MKIVNKSIFKKLKRPDLNSHKGQNGRVLIIAGSDKFHGALLLAVQTASRIVDMVYVHSIESNLEFVKKLRSEISVFIAVGKKELWDIIDLVDVVIIGPGLEESKETVLLTEKLLKEHKDKKLVLDATSLWHVNPNLIHDNVILTPHSREFENVFKCEPIAENVQKMARKHSGIIVLKGRKDYISNGKELYENQTGNVGMTKGGTGDVLAGVVGSLAATNDCLTAALAGAYLTGYAGDKVFEKVGTFYNAEDVIEELRMVWKEVLGLR